MTKRLALLFAALALSSALYGQSSTPTETGSELTAGKTATLGVEATTAFAWDLDKNTTGLETKAGMELLFPLFPAADRGVFPEGDTAEPAVRLLIKNATFLWRPVFETRGGNYEQDSFNAWGSPRPLILTFDTFLADLLWRNYFLRLAGTTLVMRTNRVSLRSIFDDVIDARDRYYYRSSTRALWFADRYNIQKLPLLQGKLIREYVDDDYRSLEDISGNIAAGAEFDWFSVAVKAASNKNGYENDANAWLLGADIDLVPLENLKLGFSSLAGFNYDKAPLRTSSPNFGRNPVDFGLLAEYRLFLSDTLILSPFTGIDFSYDTVSEESKWEFGAGVFLYTRGYDFLASSRMLDWDEVIPAGASLSMNMNQDSGMNMVLSWFEPAGPDSPLPNFGGFLQLELGDLTGKGTGPDYAVLAQAEYSINGKFIPYIRGGYKPEFYAGSTDRITGDYLVKAAFGVFMMPVHFFSFDLCYEMDTRLITDGGGSEYEKSQLSAVFTIRM